MLVLTRRVGQRILIGDSIKVEIVDVDRGNVRVAVHAPREIPVDREEVRASKNREGNSDEPTN